MNRFLRIAINVLVWSAILAYLVFATRHCREQQQEERLKRVEIRVTDYGERRAVSPQIVREWLDDAQIALEGERLAALDTEHIVRMLAAQPHVREVQTYMEQSGTMHITLSQRRPIVRFVRGDVDFYVSDDLWVIPAKMGAAEYVPVVTGDFGLPFETGWFGRIEEPEATAEKKLHKNYAFLLKLINFVRLTEQSPFWSAAIVQINVREPHGVAEWREPEIEFVPRVGNHIVALGTLDDAAEKLAKLLLFYRNVLHYEGWDKYTLIDVRYRGQVVGR
ncbi:MAG: hypothetical protein FWE10_03390 [Rikenellaceae bacterium]|nr:hypothetical protein [Rikenellaceae bacterium]MCL2693070.1 hypothetical protein [Rikenellaceae bacterium]